MPLLKKRLYEPTGDLHANSREESLFLYPYTGEVFDTYEDYIEKLYFYKEKQFSCRFTGKSNLTFVEAYYSERDIIKSLQRFPATHVVPLIEIIHNSPLNLEDLVDYVYKRFCWEFVPGEEAFAVRRGDIIPVMVIELEKKPNDSELSDLPPPNLQLDSTPTESKEKSDQDSTDAPNTVSSVLSKFTYKVQLKAQPKGSTDVSSPFSISGASLNRSRVVIDKILIRHKIREISQRTTPLNGRWVVSHDLIKSLSIDESRLTPSPEPNPAKKRKSTGKEKEEKPVVKKEPKITKEEKREIRKNETLERRLKKKEELKVQREKAAAEKRLQKMEERKKKRQASKPIKYPIEDEEVPESERLSEQPCPTLSKDFIVETTKVGPIIMVWNFISTYGKLCKISPFSLDDFMDGLSMKEKCPLVTTVIVQFLKMIMENENAEGDRPVNGDNWENKLVSFLSSESSGYDEFVLQRPDTRLLDYARSGYSRLRLKDKMDLLELLLQKVLETDEMRSALESSIEKIAELKQEAREQDVNDRKELLETKESVVTNENEPQSNGTAGSSDPKAKAKPKDNKNQQEYENRVKTRQETLKREIAKHTVRTTALGFDRHWKRYWNFQDGRVFVEEHVGSDGDWGFYDRAEELEQLKGHFNEKGLREQKVKEALVLEESKLVPLMRKRMQDMESNIEFQYARRSARTKQNQKLRPCMTYFNKLT